MELFEIRDMLAAAEREAAQLILHADHIMAESKTGKRDVVTEYDRKVQLLLEERIRERIPDAKFFCEEMDERDDLHAEHVFIIDPIDGTMNFVKSFRHSCISVAYASGGTVLAAVVYNPYADEMFSAVKGQGTLLNGKPVRADDAPLADCVVCCGTSPYVPELLDRSFKIMYECCRAGLDIRRQGAAALDLCSVAAGRAGLFMELSLCLWDYAAGKLLVEEAGGVCFTEDGKELPFTGEKCSILAGGKNAVKDYFELVRPGI